MTKRKRKNGKQLKDGLTVCAIVKDEELNIIPFVRNLLEFADEIIITDTGSSDLTIKAMAMFGDKIRVNYFHWNGSFADARNFGIDKATHKWVMFMDADDRMEDPDVEKMHKIKFRLNQLKKTKFYSFGIISGASGQMDFQQPRMFYNEPKNRFIGKIHEIMDDGANRKDTDIGFTSVRIYHLGYDDPEVVHRKVLRNKPRLEEEIPNMPNDVRLRHLLANSYIHLSGKETDEKSKQIMKDKALVIYEEIIKICKRRDILSSDIGYSTLALLVNHYGQRKATDKALDAAEKLRELRPDELYGYTYLAKVYFSMRDYGACRRVLLAGEGTAKQTLYFVPTNYPEQISLAKEMMTVCNDMANKEEAAKQTGELHTTKNMFDKPEKVRKSMRIQHSESKRMGGQTVSESPEPDKPKTDPRVAGMIERIKKDADKATVHSA